MPKTCNAEGCDQFVFGKGYCKSHQYLRVDKSKPKSIQKVSIKRNSKPSGELFLFKEIWNTRKHISFVTGLKIEPDEFSVSLFHHVVAKSKTEKARLDERNIIIITPFEHMLIHFGTIEQRENYGYAEGWKRIEELKQQLLEEYNND